MMTMMTMMMMMMMMTLIIIIIIISLENNALGYRGRARPADLVVPHPELRDCRHCHSIRQCHGATGTDPAGSQINGLQCPALPDAIRERTGAGIANVGARETQSRELGC
jgi:hypothetical protein